MTVKLGATNQARRVSFLLPTLAGGGAERVAVNALQMIPEAERHLVLMENRIAYDYDAELHILAGDLTANISAAERLKRLALNLAALTRLKRRLHGATWLSFTSWANILNVLAPGEGPVIISSHNNESANIRGRSAPLVRALIRATYPRADAVVAVSDSVRDDLVENFRVPRERIRTIYNTVDLGSVDRMAAEPVEGPLAALLAHPTVIAAGSLTQQKGHWHLIRVFANLHDRIPEARLVILGEGPLGPYLSELARAAGLRVWAAWEDRPRDEIAQAEVVFLGFVRNPFSCIQRARVFAFPSLWEGFGNVILEALACGRVVLAADCKSGPREILAPGSPNSRPIIAAEHALAGILMPLLDGERRPARAPLTPEECSWSDELTLALQDAALRERYGTRGRERSLAFTIDAIAPKWRSLLLRG